MFPRRKRLQRADFEVALARGRRLSSPHFSVTIPVEAEGYAVVVSKKVARLSVTRHRIKRRVLEALRTLKLPRSLIIFPKSTVASMEYKEIQAELASLLSKI